MCGSFPLPHSSSLFPLLSLSPSDTYPFNGFFLCVYWLKSRPLSLLLPLLLLSVFSKCLSTPLCMYCVLKKSNYILYFPANTELFKPSFLTSHILSTEKVLSVDLYLSYFKIYLTAFHEPLTYSQLQILQNSYKHIVPLISLILCYLVL